MRIVQTTNPLTDRQLKAKEKAAAEEAKELKQADETQPGEEIASTDAPPFDTDDDQDDTAAETPSPDVPEEFGEFDDDDDDDDDEPHVIGGAEMPESMFFTAGIEEKKLLDAIYKIELARDQLDAETIEARERLADLEAELSATKKTKAALLETLPASLVEIRNGATASEAITSATAEPAGPNWEARPLRDIATDIKGLGEEKLSKLCDLCETIGSAEELRTQAANTHKHFSTLLPSGIGKQIADELARRIIEAQTAPEKTAEEQIKDRLVAEAVGEAETVHPGGEPDSEYENVDDADSEESSDESIESFDLNELIAELSAGSLDDGGESMLWESGFDAFEESIDIEDCPYDDGPSARLWLMGWLAAELDNVEPEDEASEPPVPEPEPVNPAAKKPEKKLKPTKKQQPAFDL